MPKAATEDEQLLTSTNPSTVELSSQQQAIQRDTNAIISKFSNSSIKNDHFLADIQMYDGKDYTSFLDWITWVEKIARLTQCLKIQLVSAKAEGIVYKLINDMPSHQHGMQ